MDEMTVFLYFCALLQSCEVHVMDPSWISGCFYCSQKQKDTLVRPALFLPHLCLLCEGWLAVIKKSSPICKHYLSRQIIDQDSIAWDTGHFWLHCKSFKCMFMAYNFGYQIQLLNIWRLYQNVLRGQHVSIVLWRFCRVSELVKIFSVEFNLCCALLYHSWPHFR